MVESRQTTTNTKKHNLAFSIVGVCCCSNPVSLLALDVLDEGLDLLDKGAVTYSYSFVPHSYTLPSPAAVVVEVSIS